MKLTQNFQNNNSTLYLVATPIGNLEDITLRAIRILKEVDYIFCEDTRHSRTLLEYYDISNKVDSYFEFNKDLKGDKIINLLKEGNNIALITDAGTPGISDPGYEIIKLAIEYDFNVVAVPGASAIIAALITSGLVIQPFTFLGFLPRGEEKQKTILEDYLYRSETLVIYEASNRIYKTLDNIYHSLGNRKISIAREITKKFETIIRGYVLDIIKENPDIVGECVIVVEGGDPKDYFNDFTIDEHVKHYLDLGFNEKDAMKMVAKDRGKSKSEIYKLYKIRREK
ncbi:MAG TPA: 16S rRNA (cytidine(1402)-2'-O)-methyltransferase [Acholeplasmataceae bacterium]|nr:16S rRNA (cytidine(1402)-2'-O)-methyltransferase [Acholeplasmataceae bacterium]